MKILDSYSTLKDYRSDPLAFILKVHRKQGHRIKLDIFGNKLFIISHPDDVLHVLKSNASAYSKGRTTKALRTLLGSGLITNEGDSWRKQHKLIRPIMNPASIYALAPKILKTCEEFLPEFERSIEVDAFKAMNQLTWRIVLRTLFSQETTPGMDAWLEEILELMRIVTQTTRSVIKWPLWVPTAKNRRLKKIVSRFDAYVYKIIRERRTGERREDFLQLLIDANDGGSMMSDGEIRDEAMTFLMAGHETITNSMSWALIELARNKEVIPRLQEEAARFYRSRNFEELQASPWLSAVIDEVMRLWPPVWLFMRQAERPDVVGGMEIPVGANVVLGTYLSHHSSDFWDRPEAFHPQRFLGEAKKKLTPGSFYPFGLGPRACIGAYFAGIEAKIIMSTILQNFDWDIVRPEVQKSEAHITLRPVNNVLMSFRRR